MTAAASTAAPQAVKANPGRRVDWLDALRGWAILGVVLVHSGQNVAGLAGPWKQVADAGQYGVQLFYVVSALTIGLTYERQLQRDGDPLVASAAWLVRRYLRIAPLYYYGIALYLMVFAAMRAMGSQLAPNAPWDVIANILFVHGWVPSAQNTVVPGGWSIAVEMCFYLVAPVIFLAVRTARASIVAFVLATAAAWILDRHVAAATGSAAIANNSFLYFWFPTQLPVFMAGIALYRCAGCGLWTGAALSGGVSAAIALATAVCLALGLELGTAGNLDHSLAPTVIGVAFCAFALLCQQPVARSLLVTRATVRLGQISYSVYINHFVAILALRFLDKRLHLWDALAPPVALVAVMGAAMVLAVAMSLVTQRWIEAPGIDLGHRLAGLVEARARPAVSRSWAKSSQPRAGADRGSVRCD